MRPSIPIDVVAEAIIDAMRSSGYADGTVYVTRLCLGHLREYCLDDGGRYSAQVGERFADVAVSPRTGRPSRALRKQRARLVRLVDSYVESGVVDLSVMRKPGVPPALEEHRRLLASWDTRMAELGWAAQTVSQHARYARRFLLHLEQRGGGLWIGDAPGSSAVEFLTHLTATVAATSMRTVVSALRAFFAFAGRDDLAGAVSLFRFDRKRVTLPTLSDAAIEAVACLAGSSDVSVRDLAITLLAVTTGLRACDIAGLVLGDIDWRAGQISIVQRKTGNPLSLPLPAAAGNAVSRYLLEIRPATADAHVFIRASAPLRGLSGAGAVRGAMKRVFARAGLPSDGVGSRLTRHNMASRMLAGRVPLPVISAVLGHADPKSVDAYLDTDVEQMRLCVLALPGTARL
jgi:integrase